MVATIRVLKGNTTGIADYLTNEQTGDYYAVERNGSWCGGAAKELGLSGIVDRNDFEKILAGQRRNGTRITRKWKTRQSDAKQHAQRCPGYDQTFSAPKSVSMAWALASAERQKQIEQAMYNAVRKTLAVLEEVTPLGRRGKGGLEQIHGKIAAALFMHCINRDEEPQLHIHAVIANCLFGSDGKWSAVNSRMLHSWTPALGRIFRCNLAQELRDGPGFDLYRPRNADGKDLSWFEIKGIPQPLIDANSSRRKAIEKEINGNGGDLGSSTAKSRERANLKTRKRKGATPTLSELLERWRDVADRFGIDATSIERLCDRAKKNLKKDPYEKAFKKTLEELTNHEAHFEARDVVLGVCEKLQHLGMNGNQTATRVMEDLERNQNIVPLEQLRGEPRYTTREMWELESKMLADCEWLKGRGGATVSSDEVDDVIRENDSLSEEQGKAAVELMTANSSIRVLSGLAGAGKSYTLNAVRDGFERAGFQVFGGALAGAAKEELVRQTNIESRTVASYLYLLEKPILHKVKDRIRHDARQIRRAAVGKKNFNPKQFKLTDKSVLIIDEAAMLGTRSLAKLVGHVRAAGATLILCGDPHQLNPIEAGAPAKHIAKAVPESHLKTNRRQVRAADRNAVASIRSGDSAEAISNYAKRGLVSVSKNRDEAVDDLIAAWAKAGGRENPREHMVFAQTKAEAKLVNAQCQRERLRTNRRDAKRFIATGDDRYYVGDRVLFNKPYRRKFIENGYGGTIISVSPKTRRITIRLDQEPTETARKRGASRVVTLSTRDIKSAEMSLGFAATTHKLQGQTVANSYLLLCSRMTSREMAYTQATRGKHSTRLFVDELSAGKDLQDLVRSVNRSKAKTLAHDLRKRNVEHVANTQSEHMP